MTATCFNSMLGQYLQKLQGTVEQINEARQLCQPATALEAILSNDLTAYTWAVRSRTLLLAAASSSEREQAIELHTRLSVVEILAGLQWGQLPAPSEAAPGQPAPLQALRQRLVTLEGRLFHLFGVAPLN